MHTNDLEGRYTIDGVGRIYSNNEDLWLPSVSTVIDVRETPEQLKRWKERTDNHEEIQQYKQNFGTLAHEYCQQDIMPTDPETGEPIDELWGKDEQQSEDQLKECGNWERFQEEFEWVKTAWETIKLVTNFDTVLDTETFVCNTDIGYAGQFDLLYQDEEADETVLADIKTSKDVYEKHLLQLSAYRMAVPINIDRMEIIRINPERKDWRVLPDTEWSEDPEDLETEFMRLRGELEQKQLKTIIETVQDSDTEEEGVMYEEM